MSKFRKWFEAGFGSELLPDHSARRSTPGRLDGQRAHAWQGTRCAQ